MSVMRIKKLLISIALTYFIWSSCSIPAVVAQYGLPTDARTGPFLEKIKYVHVNETGLVGEETALHVQALIDGDVDILSTTHHLLEEVAMLREAENIEVVQSLRSAFWGLRVNCEVWPFNITGVRQALHYAIDKRAINNIQDTPMCDSPIVATHPMSIESEMEEHYYDADVAKGTEILDNLGFLDSDSDNLREGPGGHEIGPIEVKFYRHALSGPLYEDAADLVVEALEKLNISAYTTRIFDWNEALDIIDNLDLDVMVFGLHGHRERLDTWARGWINAFSDWNNESFISAAETVLQSTDCEVVTQAAKEMQRIFIDGAAEIVIGTYPLYTAHRTDKFEGFVNHAAGGSHNFFTGLKVYNSTANSTGSTINWAISHENVQLEHYTSIPIIYCTFGTEQYIMEMMHDSLARFDENLNIMNWLAEDYVMTCHQDDTDVPDGNTRIIIDIVNNATWSDGTAITADDVVFSINFFREQEAFNTWLSELCVCISKTSTQLEIQFSSECYWHLYAILFLPILPKHVPDQYLAENNFRVTPEQFNEGLVTSGPFMTSEWLEGEYIEVAQNPYYWKNPRLIQHASDTDTATLPDYTLPIISGVIAAAAIVSLGGLFILRRPE